MDWNRRPEHSVNSVNFSDTQQQYLPQNVSSSFAFSQSKLSPHSSLNNPPPYPKSKFEKLLYPNKNEVAKSSHLLNLLIDNRSLPVLTTASSDMSSSGFNVQCSERKKYLEGDVTAHSLEQIQRLTEATQQIVPNYISQEPVSHLEKTILPSQTNTGNIVQNNLQFVTSHQYRTPHTYMLQQCSPSTGSLTPNQGDQEYIPSKAMQLIWGQQQNCLEPVPAQERLKVPFHQPVNQLENFQQQNIPMPSPIKNIQKQIQYATTPSHATSLLNPNSSMSLQLKQFVPPPNVNAQNMPQLYANPCVYGDRSATQPVQNFQDPVRYFNENAQHQQQFFTYDPNNGKFRKHCPPQNNLDNQASMSLSVRPTHFYNEPNEYSNTSSVNHKNAESNVINHNAVGLQSATKSQHEIRAEHNYTVGEPYGIASCNDVSDQPANSNVNLADAQNSQVTKEDLAIDIKKLLELKENFMNLVKQVKLKRERFFKSVAYKNKVFSHEQPALTTTDQSVLDSNSQHSNATVKLKTSAMVNTAVQRKLPVLRSKSQGRNYKAQTKNPDTRGTIKTDGGQQNDQGPPMFLNNQAGLKFQNIMMNKSGGQTLMMGQNNVSDMSYSKDQYKQKTPSSVNQIDTPHLIISTSGNDHCVISKKNTLNDQQLNSTTELLPNLQKETNTLICNVKHSEGSSAATERKTESNQNFQYSANSDVPFQIKSFGSLSSDKYTKTLNNYSDRNFSISEQVMSDKIDSQLGTVKDICTEIENSSNKMENNTFNMEILTSCLALWKNPSTHIKPQNKLDRNGVSDQTSSEKHNPSVLESITSPISVDEQKITVNNINVSSAGDTIVQKRETLGSNLMKGFEPQVAIVSPLILSKAKSPIKESENLISLNIGNPVLQESSICTLSTDSKQKIMVDVSTMADIDTLATSNTFSSEINVEPSKTDADRQQIASDGNKKVEVIENSDCFSKVNLTENGQSMLKVATTNLLNSEGIKSPVFQTHMNPSHLESQEEYFLGNQILNLATSVISKDEGDGEQLKISGICSLVEGHSFYNSQIAKIFNHFCLKQSEECSNILSEEIVSDTKQELDSNTPKKICETEISSGREKVTLLPDLLRKGNTAESNPAQNIACESPSNKHGNVTALGNIDFSSTKNKEPDLNQTVLCSEEETFDGQKLINGQSQSLETITSDTENINSGNTVEDPKKNASAVELLTQINKNTCSDGTISAECSDDQLSDLLREFPFGIEILPAVVKKPLTKNQNPVESNSLEQSERTFDEGAVITSPSVEDLEEDSINQIQITVLNPDQMSKLFPDLATQPSSTADKCSKNESLTVDSKLIVSPHKNSKLVKENKVKNFESSNKTFCCLFSWISSVYEGGPKCKCSEASCGSIPEEANSNAINVEAGRPSLLTKSDSSLENISTPDDDKVMKVNISQKEKELDTYKNSLPLNTSKTIIKEKDKCKKDSLKLHVADSLEDPKKIRSDKNVHKVGILSKGLSVETVSFPVKEHKSDNLSVKRKCHSTAVSSEKNRRKKLIVQTNFLRNRSSKHEVKSSKTFEREKTMKAKEPDSNVSGTNGVNVSDNMTTKIAQDSFQNCSTFVAGKSTTYKEKEPQNKEREKLTAEERCTNKEKQSLVEKNTVNIEKSHVNKDKDPCCNTLVSQNNVCLNSQNQNDSLQQKPKRVLSIDEYLQRRKQMENAKKNATQVNGGENEKIQLDSEKRHQCVTKLNDGNPGDKVLKCQSVLENKTYNPPRGQSSSSDGNPGDKVLKCQSVLENKTYNPPRGQSSSSDGNPGDKVLKCQSVLENKTYNPPKGQSSSSDGNPGDKVLKCQSVLENKTYNPPRGQSSSSDGNPGDKVLKCQSVLENKTHNPPKGQPSSSDGNPGDKVLKCQSVLENKTYNPPKGQPSSSDGNPGDKVLKCQSVLENKTHNPPKGQPSSSDGNPGDKVLKCQSVLENKTHNPPKGQPSSSDGNPGDKVLKCQSVLENKTHNPPKGQPSSSNQFKSYSLHKKEKQPIIPRNHERWSKHKSLGKHSKHSKNVSCLNRKDKVKTPVKERDQREANKHYLNRVSFKCTAQESISLTELELKSSSGNSECRRTVDHALKLKKTNIPCSQNPKIKKPSMLEFKLCPESMFQQKNVDDNSSFKTLEEKQKFPVEAIPVVLGFGRYSHASVSSHKTTSMRSHVLISPLLSDPTIVS
ncbi:retroelement silencing factor 1 isoform X2 [Rhinatrema bivittatum]|uniref:retroelement silencing factor 1 isoform X2 n=2 Tax=Rhinatrema bivittatum TaxID=194408 RepID=UPI00112A232E|nr:retroelement silencing factor 1 isoform X2 [Rhinatrema bivittatum]